MIAKVWLILFHSPNTASNTPIWLEGEGDTNCETQPQKSWWEGRESITRSSEQGRGGIWQNRRQPSATGEWRAEGSFQLEEQERLSGAIEDSSGKR